MANPPVLFLCSLLLLGLTSATVHQDASSTPNTPLTQLYRGRQLPETSVALQSVPHTTAGVQDPVTSLESAGHGQGRRQLAARKGGRFSKCRIWVNQKGTNGAYRTIQEAVNKAGTGRTKICVMPGVYRETIHIRPGQNYITMEGAGRNTYIIGGTTRSKHPQQKTFYTAAFVVEGDYFVGKRFQIENPYKSTWDPSPALTCLGQRSQWYSVGFHAWIDTIGIFTSRHYFKNCYVGGLADIIWGFGRGAFEQTTIYIRYYQDPRIKYIGYITALGTDWPSNGVMSGAVFWNCRVIGDAQAYLGRPYRPNVEVAFINSYLSNAVYQQTWSDFNGMAKQGTLAYMEYQCTGPGANSKRMQFGRWTNNPAPLRLRPTTFLQ